ncbi:hypothetical protein ACQZ6F_19005 [Rhizobium sp. A22-96]
MTNKFERRERVIDAFDSLYGLLGRFDEDEYKWKSLRKDGAAVVADLEAAYEDGAAIETKAAIREARELLGRVQELREMVGRCIDLLNEIEDNDDLGDDPEIVAAS